MIQKLTAASFPRRARDRQNGFTMVEALIVMVIGMILMALAVPMVQSAIRIYTINSATSNLSRMVQQIRYNAISEGSNKCTLLAGNQFGIDSNCDGAFAPNDVRIQVPVGVSLSQTSPTTPTASMPFPAAPTEFPVACTNYAVTFNPRGSKTSVCGAATGVAVTQILFLTGWGTTNNAVTITGTGRAKSWRWNGTAWR